MADYTIKQSDIDECNDNNATLYINDTEASEGDTLSTGDTLKVIANDGYSVYEEHESDNGTTTSVYITYFEGGLPETKEFTIEDDQTATLEYDENYLDKSDATLNVNTEQASPDYTIKQSDIDECNDNNATLYVNDEEAKEDDPVFIGDELKVIADDGYIVFDDYDEGNTTTTSVYIFYVVDGVGEVKGFDLEDDQTAKLTYDEDYLNKEGAELRVNTKQPTPEVISGNNVYLVDEGAIKTINHERFTISKEDVVDLGDYILGLIYFPFSIPEDYILEKEKIVLGDKETSVESDLISSDRIKLDLGEITVNETYEDFRDYDNVVCKLHLPYVPVINIDPYYVIGETIKIEYIINVYNGVTTINISSSKINDNVFLTQTSDIGIAIPYSQGVGNIENFNIIVGGENNITTAFLEVSSNEAVLSDGFFTTPITDEDELKNQEGYVVVDNIRLETEATEEEASQIESELQNGVIL